MKDKELKIKVDDNFIGKVDYLQMINSYKNRSDTVRQVVEKEYFKERFSAERDRVLQTRLFAKEDFVKRWLFSQGWDGKDTEQARKLAEGWVVCEHFKKGEITFTMEKENDK